MAGGASQTATHLAAPAVGAIVGGVAGWLFAPGYFWALLIGGALGAGALRVGYILFTADDRGPGSS